jgi:hypothetical protein
MAKAYKRIAFIGDLHCGHRAGLTPPQWRFRECATDHVWRKFTQVQTEAWKHYARIVKSLMPVDCLVVNGDLIDGRGEKSGGVELITGDRNEQCKMAADCIRLWKAGNIVMTRGTGYHVGDIESWEDIVADMLRADGSTVKIGDHEWVDVNGHIFDCKHHVGSSGIPHGRFTAASKDELWNLLWAEAGQQPRADTIIRSHVHYCAGGYRYVNGKRKEFMTLPALQQMGTRFGARRCSGLVDWGLIAFDLDKNGNIICRHEHIVPCESTVAKTVSV